MGLVGGIVALSKLIADRMAILRTVRTALQVHGPDVVPEIEKLVFPDGIPQNLTVAGFLTAVDKTLERYGDALIASDEQHAAELADDGGIRASRDARIHEVRNYLSSLRDVITANYGAEVAAAYGLSGPTTDEAQHLLNTSKTSAKLLRSRPLTEAPRNKSLKIDPLLAADDLDEHNAALSKALDDVEREKREAQATLSAKDAQVARWPVVYSGSADVVAALFVLGGRPELAEKVRPTARRRAGTPEADDGQGAPLVGTPNAPSTPSTP